MIDRKEFAEELILRENVRKAIKVVLTKREKTKLVEKQQESELRDIIRSLLPESSAVASVAKHDSTGINALEDLLRNTNILSTLETGYKSLTTNVQQRESYRNHILTAVEKSLAPEESRKEAGEDEELGAVVNEDLEEDIDINVDSPEDDPAFISVEDEEEEEVDPKDSFAIAGEDKTGRNRAFTDFNDIEKNILTAYDDLDNPADTTMFEEYLLKNLALYFDKFESELQTNVPEPAVAAAAVADANLSDDELDDGDVAPLELQEVISLLDIDDIIENLL
jgi:hypothetical protein|tara:strand:+ start:2732 stop:3571 length:840 start_codon:yes stop_codon:yes gene_type:complete